ncbi:MAG: hypothetical protein OER88_03845 [Planctomycetota bacterium]|nr:hypothetical protein [Planctomycetota bacterium]
MAVLERAREFLWTQARLLDKRIFQCRFEGGPAADVVAALRAYRNDDGGFGHALEADLRAPGSQPIHVEIALQCLLEAGVHDAELTAGACAFLASVANEDGAVPPSLPGAADYPCAAHWAMLEWALAPALNPTASIAAHLHALGVTHPWLDRATEWSLGRIAEDSLPSAHTVRAALLLCENRPALRERVLDQLAAADWFTTETPVTRYALTPLHMAPTPESPARSYFADDLIERHLDDLIARQQDDGGWPVLWEAPGPAAVCEWRGRWTLDALLTLRAYGRI